MVAATTKSRRDPSMIRSDVSIAVARTAVVVAVMVATVVLRNSVRRRGRCDRRVAYHPGSGRRDRVPVGPEGVQALAVRLALPLVLDERVERMVVVGHLSTSVGALGRSEQGRPGACARERLAGRDQGRPEGRTHPGAGALAVPV